MKLHIVCVIHYLLHIWAVSDVLCLDLFIAQLLLHLLNLIHVSLILTLGHLQVFLESLVLFCELVYFFLLFINLFLQCYIGCIMFLSLFVLLI